MDKLKHYLNQSPTVFFILRKNKTWQLEYVTHNVVDIYGVDSADFLSGKRTHDEFIHKDDLVQFQNEAKQLSKVINDEYIYEPYRVVRKDKIIWVNHITKIIRKDDGQVSHYYGYLTDITIQKELYNKLETTQNIFDSMFHNSFHSIILLDNNAKVLKSNKTILSLLNIKEQDIFSSYFWDIPLWNLENEKVRIKKQILDLIKNKNFLNDKYSFNLDEHKKYLNFSFSPILNDKKELLYIKCEGQDITEKEETRQSLEQYIKIVNENILISITDKDGFILDLSDAYCKFTGYDKNELIGKTHKLFKYKDNDDYVFKELWTTIKKGKLWKGEHQNIKKDGSVFWVENSITPNLDQKGNIIGYTSIYNDITDKKEISELLITDYLTKIYNRRHFNTVFDIELKRSKRDKKNFVLMILDIDYFKQYNDTYGHDAGDKALYSVANALKYTLKRSEDFLFRLGGEEFGIITSGVDKEGVLILAEKLRESIINLQIEHTGSFINDNLTISIGIKVVEFNSDLIENDIYKLADKALYEAKERGRNKAIVCTQNKLIK